MINVYEFARYINNCDNIMNLRLMPLLLNEKRYFETIFSWCQEPRLLGAREKYLREFVSVGKYPMRILGCLKQKFKRVRGLEKKKILREFMGARRKRTLWEFMGKGGYGSIQLGFLGKTRITDLWFLKSKNATVTELLVRFQF